MQDRERFDTRPVTNKGDRIDGHPDDAQPDKTPEDASKDPGFDQSAHQSNRSAQSNRNDQVLMTQSETCDSQDLSIDELIDSYSRFLFGYAYRLAGSVSDAEDLTQQTFLIAHQKLSQLRSQAAAKSWLCAILRSCWLKSIRRAQPKPVSSMEIELSEILVDRNNEFEFDSQAIQNALHELPPDYRLVLLMFYFEDLSYQEIAQKLNVKMGTVMSRLSRAKERVRLRLKNKEGLLDK